MSQKPVAAIVLSIIGGLMNTWTLRWVVPNLPVGLLNVLWPLIPLAGSMMLFVSPGRHRIWGALVLGFSLASWVLLGSFVADIVAILAIK